MSRRQLLLLLFAFGAAAAAAAAFAAAGTATWEHTSCVPANPAPIEDGALTVEGVYKRAGEALRRPGLVYHATVEVEADYGFVAYKGVIEQWVEGCRDVAREAMNLGDRGGYTWLLTKDARYARNRNSSDHDSRLVTTAGRTWICHGAGVAASAVLGCPAPQRGRALRSGRASTRDGRRSSW